MPILMPSIATLACAVADTLVIAADPAARDASATWWEHGRPWATAVAQAVSMAQDDEIRSLGDRLRENPADPRPHAEMVSSLLNRDRESDPASSLFDLAWAAECNSRLGYHLGRRYSQGKPVIDVDALQRMPPASSLGAGADATILIVIPFRDNGSGRHRLRNLLACLLALRDQSYPRQGYRVTVVETDAVPRWRDIIAPFADHYLFALDPGHFNKSWAVNAGAVHSPGQPEAICILDADVLVDREFVARNVARFRNPGTGGHLTYRNMLCLDPAASSLAIDERLSRQAQEADPDRLRGFLLRRPPGCCIWVRAEAFFRIGGMDERYRGWGGEDYDFTHRLDLETPLDAYDDWLLHLHHPPAPMSGPYAESANARIPSLSWQPTEPIGRLDRLASLP